MEMHGLIKKAFTRGWACGTLAASEEKYAKKSFLTSDKTAFIAGNSIICNFWNCRTFNKKKWYKKKQQKCALKKLCKLLWKQIFSKKTNCYEEICWKKYLS